MKKESQKEHRKIIREPKITISACDFEFYKLKELKNCIDSYIEQYGENAGIAYSESGYDMYSESPQYQIYINREENDKEYNERIEKEEEYNKRALEYDLKQYEILKKKFEDQ